MEIPVLLNLQEVINENAGIVIAQQNQLPFQVKRVYWVHHIPEGQVRGHHAHLTSRKIVISLQGEIKIELENIKGDKYHFVLAAPHVGLYIPSLHWGRFQFGKNALMISLASDIYDEKDYIRDYEEFKELNNE